MPAYSFQERFVPMVLDGSKSQTVRTRRKHPAKKGDTLYLFYGLRTKWSKKLREEICSDTRTIMITEEGNVLIFDEWIERLPDLSIVPNFLQKLYGKRFKLLNEQEANLFAYADGFRPDGSSPERPEGCFDIMLRWWKQTHELPFIGDIIYWDTKPLTKNQ